MPATTLTLIAKPGCHLCDDARVVVDRVLGELRRGGLGVQLVERNILEDQQLEAQYADDIPVVLIDGRVHGRWCFEPDALRADLLA